MEKHLKILILEDSAGNADLIQNQLNDAGIKFESKVVSTKEEFSNELESYLPDIILSNHSMPHLNSMDALKVLKARKFKVPFILVTSSVSDEFIVRVMQEGASDYILKDRLGSLPGAILNALEKFNIEKEGENHFNEIVAKEALLSKVEKLAHIGSWQHNVVTNNVTWADETFYIYGYYPGQVAPSFEAFLTSVHPDDQLNVKTAIDEAYAGNGDTLKISFRLINKNNSLKYASSEMFFERDKEQEVTLITGFVQDITIPKLADEKLYASQTHLLASQHIGHVGSWEILDLTINDPLNGSPLYWSDEAFRIFGMEPGEINMTTNIFLQIVHPDDRNLVSLKFREAFDGRKDYDIDHRIIRKDGTERFVHELGVIIYDPKTRKRLKMIGTVQDITDRKKSEEAIKESEERYRLVATHPLIGIAWASLEGKILYANETFCKMLGYSPDELHNVYFGDLTFPGDMEMEVPLLEKLVKGQINNYRIEKRHITKTGIPIWTELNISLITNTSGFQYLIGIVQNINDRKIAESEREKAAVRLIGANKELAFQNEEKEKRAAELIIANKELKIAELERVKITADLIQRNNDLEQFTYIVSHNLRAPVANIMGFSEALIDDGLKESQTQEIARALSDSVRRLDEVIHDLNDILNVKTEFSVMRELVKLSSIVDDIKANNNQLIIKENVTIKTDFIAVNELFTIKSYLYSIFYNLISNSIKYHIPGITPVLEIKSVKTDNKIILSFKDNGLGIDLNKRGDQVFGLYKRFHLQIEGKGMGLFMVKTQVEALGGKISISSHVNKGTEFTIEFSL